jgi:DNA-binding response OmpR family regulator
LFIVKVVYDVFMTKSEISVLIVDDEPDLLEICADAFEMEDYKVLTAVDGVKGLEAFMNNNVDVIISDSYMPEMNGLQLLKTILDSEKDMPIFYLSTGAIDITEDTLKEKGATGLISKPFDLDEILERVSNDLKAR